MKKLNKIMAGLMSVCLCVANVSATCISVSAESSENNWKYLYKEALNQLVTDGWTMEDNFSFNGSRFDLYELNGDDIPELFVTHDNANHAEGIIFSVVNGKLTKSSVGVHYGSIMVNSAEHMVYYNANTSLLASPNYYRFSDGILYDVTNSGENFDNITFESTGFKYSFDESVIKEVFDSNEFETSAVSLIDKSIPEIISIMNGEYQIISTEFQNYVYIQNQSVFPGMEFYVEIGYEIIESIPWGNEIDSDILRDKLENGELVLDGIQVNKSGKVNDLICADMNYKSCSDILGDFKCTGGIRGYFGGDVGALIYTYNDNNAKIRLHFDIPKEVEGDVFSGKIHTLSAEQMKTYNPELINVVIKKNNDITTIITTTTQTTTSSTTTTTTTTTITPPVTVIGLGDINGDGRIDAVDATAVSIEYANLATGGDFTLTDEQKKASDVNGDGLIDSVDSTYILRYYAKVSTGESITFDEFVKNN